MRYRRNGDCNQLGLYLQHHSFVGERPEAGMHADEAINPEVEIWESLFVPESPAHREDTLTSALNAPTCMNFPCVVKAKL